MALWNMESGNGAYMMLWRTGPYKFRVMEYRGEPGDMLTNYDYILFHRKYEGALRSTGAQLQLTPVTITDEVRKKVWRNYLEATIINSVSGEEVWGLSPVGPAIYKSAGSTVFVSNALKEILQQVEGQSFWFSPGLRLFG
jgi:hypothetical protein